MSKNGKKFDPHAELGVRADASPDEVRRAFRRRSHETHPDKSGGSAEAFIRAKTAHRLLTDPAARERWERTGDPDEPKRPEDAAESELAMLFVQAVEHLGDQWRIKSVKVVIENILRKTGKELAQQRNEHMAAAERWRQAAGRVSRREGLNHAREAMLARAQADERQAEERHGEERLSVAMLKLLDQYEWEVDERKGTELDQMLELMGAQMRRDLFATPKKKGKI